MDIQAWLEGTADREPPDAGQQEGFADHPGPCKDRRRHTEEDREQRRPDLPSDSSLIDLHRYRHRRLPQGRPRELAEHADVTARRRRDSRGSRASYERLQSKPAVASMFEKRARHKTKPDRYEPKTREHRKERSAQVQVEPSGKRRRSHRSADGARTAGLVQSFQLKVGAKDTRLTLKADKDAGLFKHGRASAPVLGRGAGLPDLVFNEMRFLRQPKEQQHKVQQEQDCQDGAHGRRNQEMSAYFAPDRSPIVDASKDAPNALNGPDAPNPKAPGHVTRDHRREEIFNAPDAAARPFLGFGSKGQHPKIRREPSSNESYFTWSKSQRSAVEHEAGRHGDQHGADRFEGRKRTCQVDQIPQPSAGATTTKSMAGKSPVAVGEEKSVFTPLPLPSEPPVRYPAEGPPPPPPGFNTSDILQLRLADLAHSDPDSTAATKRRKHDGKDIDKENLEPRSSTPFGDLLRQAGKAIEQHSPPSPKAAAPIHQRSPTSQPLQPARSLRKRRLQSAGGLRHSLAPITSRRAKVPVYSHLDRHMVPFDDEMLDVSPEYGLPLESDFLPSDQVAEESARCNCVRYASPQWTERPGSVAPVSEVPFSAPNESTGFGVFGRLLVAPEMTALQEEEEEGELGNFWKPHILY